MSQIEAELFVNRLLKLAEQFPGQPVGIVSEGDEFTVGVLNILPNDDDWCLNPVTLEQLTDEPNEE